MRSHDNFRRFAGTLVLATGCAIAAEDVPFVVTPDNVTLAMLELAKVGPTDYVIDLGSGDGRIVILAAKRFGARGLGIEIVPKLITDSRENARRAGVADRAEFREQDLFTTPLRIATVITMYLLPDVNLELRPKILQLEPGTRIVSHDWDMGSWKPDRTLVLDVPDKPIGLEKKSRVHLWIVPAQVAGTWCGGGQRLEIEQEYQSVKVNGERGHVDGATVRVGYGLSLRYDGGKLVTTEASGAYAPMGKIAFERTRGACS